MPKTIEVSLSRFEAMSNRHVTFQKGTCLEIMSDTHPESGEVVSVKLRYDGDGFILDGEPLMINSRPIGYGFKSSAIRGGSSRMSSGPMTWKDSAQAAIKLLYDKEREAARGYCVAQDMAFLAYLGRPVG